MKRLIVGSVSILLLSAVAAPAVKAQMGMQEPMTPQVQPFNLVHLARQGYFENQGVPAYAGLDSSVRQGSINAEDLVQAAIDQNRLSADTINDSTYLNHVNQQLRGLQQGDHRR